jgi:phosphoribosylglycinamide formyltransferase-1
MPKLNLGVLGSGKGSNYRAIQSAIDDGSLNASVRLVISDVADAGILEFARTHSVPAHHIPPGRFKTKLEPEIEAAYADALKTAGAEWVILAGFMRMLKSPMLEAFPGRIINIHPSLLPAFPGLEAWKQALDAGAPTTGCTVHYVDAGMDTGAILGQREVPVLPGDTPESLHARIQVAEHELYPEILRRIARGEA